MSTHRRLVSESSAPRRSRPLSIFSPSHSPNAKSFETVPTEFVTIVGSIEAKKTKVYHEGYLSKLDDISANGKRASDAAWERIYASLSGTVFSYWPASEFEAADTLGQMARVAPKFLNITDAQILQTPRSRDIAISTAGKNRYILRSPQDEPTSAADQWMLAIRLSLYERARLQEIYTANLFIKYQTRDTLDVPNREEKWAGLVDARMTGLEVSQQQWKRFWCVVVTESKKVAHKRASQDVFANEREIRFYNTKKDKTPEVVITNILAAYNTYPEHISLIESAGIIKLEGHLRSSGTSNSADTSGCALLIPVATEQSKRMSLTRPIPQITTMVQRILKLLYCIWTAFGLYNRPQDVLLNVDHPEALGSRLGSVDLGLTEIIECKPKSDDEASWRKALRERTVSSGSDAIVNNVPSAAFKRTGNERRVVSESSIMPQRRALVTTFEEDEELERQSRAMQDFKSSPSTFQPRVQKFGLSIAKTSPDQSRQPIASVHESFFGGLEQQRAVAPDHAARHSHPKTVEFSRDNTHDRLRPHSVHNNATNRPGCGAPVSLAALDTSLQDAKSAKDDQSLFAISPLEREQVESKYPDQASTIMNRQTVMTRDISHDSHISRASDVSRYSDGLDPSALDLVSAVVRDSSYAPSIGESISKIDGREGSIYSAYSEDAQGNGKVPDLDDETAEKIKRRIF